LFAQRREDATMFRPARRLPFSRRQFAAEEMDTRPANATSSRAASLREKSLGFCSREGGKAQRRLRLLREHLPL